MRKALLLVSLGSLFTGCAGARIVQRPTQSTSAYAPVNESERIGVISYTLRKSESTNQASREMAYKKMFDSCGGPYKIISENISDKAMSGSGAAIPVGNIVYVDNDTTIVKSKVIQFRCEK